MTTLSIQVKGAALVRQGLQNLSAEIPKVGAERIYARMVRAQAQLKTPGKRIRYPVNWDSERQRRAFFATDGFGRGIPTRRTDTYVKGWHIRRNPRAARALPGYSLINDVEYSRYVGGSAYSPGQSNIHRGRWILVRDVVEKEIEGLPAEIEEHITMVARREKL
jgi:hypothetical protein